MHNEGINTLLNQCGSEDCSNHNVGRRGRQAHSRDKADYGHETGDNPDLPLPDRQHS